MGHTDVVLELLRSGASANLRDMGGRTPTHAAVGYGHYFTVEALVKHGATLENKTVQDGETLVHFAARYGHVLELRYIVKRGAYIRALSSVRCGRVAFAATLSLARVLHVVLPCRIPLPWSHRCTQTGETPESIASAGGEKCEVSADFLAVGDPCT